MMRTRPFEVAAATMIACTLASAVTAIYDACNAAPIPPFALSCFFAIWLNNVATTRLRLLPGPQEIGAGGGASSS